MLEWKPQAFPDTFQMNQPNISHDSHCFSIVLAACYCPSGHIRLIPLKKVTCHAESSTKQVLLPQRRSCDSHCLSVRLCMQINSKLYKDFNEIFKEEQIFVMSWIPDFRIPRIKGQAESLWLLGRGLHSACAFLVHKCDTIHTDRLQLIGWWELLITQWK